MDGMLDRLRDALKARHEEAAAITEELATKTDFDFTSVLGWNEWENERLIGNGRLSDGLQLRDGKHYAVFHADYFLQRPTVLTIRVQPLPGALEMPAGTVHVCGPGLRWKRTVWSRHLGNRLLNEYQFAIGGAGYDTRAAICNGESFAGTVYILPAPAGSLATGAIPAWGKTLKGVKKAVSNANRVNPAGYTVTARYGKGPWETCRLVPTNLLPDRGLDRAVALTRRRSMDRIGR